MNKKHFIPFFVLCAAVLMSFQFIKTQLRITVISETGAYVENAEVILYNSAEDYNNSKAAYGPLKTDKKGKVIFHDVSNGPFYVEAVKGDLSNGVSAQLTDTLQEGRINKINVVVF